jgi:DNA uptake protein ComE-like DNA-binding protein
MRRRSGKQKRSQRGLAARQASDVRDAVSRAVRLAHDARRGTVLILVLVVVAMLTLGAYTFSEIMVTEAEATAMYGRQAASRAFAESGIEHAAAVLGYPESDDDLNIYHNPGRYQGVMLRDAENARGRGMFGVVAPLEGDASSTGIRFGLVDESGRINLNQLLQFGLEDAETREILMYLPEMTEDVADAILDWVDEDDDPRDYGAESDYYSSLAPPYVARNARFESVDELLQVAGVTPENLYGEDTNRNGLLDPNEDDGDQSAPFDNADGILNPGWAAYLTVDSRELNLRSDGSPKVYVNEGVLTDLYDALEEEFDEETARFIVAFRMNGPVEPLLTDDDAGLADVGALDSAAEDTTEDSSAGTSGSGAGAGSSGNGGQSASSNSSSNGGLVDAANALGNAIGAAVSGQVTRGGMDLTRGASTEIKSLYELIGAQVLVEIDDVETTLDSPWSADPGSMDSYLPTLFDTFSVTEDREIIGRINVNQARFETLAGLPGMTEELASAIVASPMIGADGSVPADALTTRSTTGWLVTQGILDLATMAKLDKYLTARGSVFRVQSVGYFEDGGGFTRMEAILDATENPVRIIFVRDLTELGRGYSQSLLTGTSGQAN